MGGGTLKTCPIQSKLAALSADIVHTNYANKCIVTIWFQKLCFSMFCALSQNYQHLFENFYAAYSKLSKKLKNSIKIQSSQAVLELLIKTIFWLMWSITFKVFLKEGTAPPTPKLTFLCSISKLSTPFWLITYAFYSKLSKKLKNSIKI